MFEKWPELITAERAAELREEALELKALDGVCCWEFENVEAFGGPEVVFWWSNGKQKAWGRPLRVRRMTAAELAEFDADAFLPYRWKPESPTGRRQAERKRQRAGDNGRQLSLF